MPFINTTTNISMSRKQKDLIDAGLREAISIIPRERAELLMVNFNDASSMALAGDKIDPCAMVEIKLLARIAAETDNSLMEKLMEVTTEVISRVLLIKPERIYVAFIGSPMWGAAGVNIENGLL